MSRVEPEGNAITPAVDQHETEGRGGQPLGSAST